MQLSWKTWFLLLLFSLSFLWPWRRAQSVNLVWTCKVWERISPCRLSESSFKHLQRKHPFKASSFFPLFFLSPLDAQLSYVRHYVHDCVREENGKRRKTWKSHLLVTATCLLDFPSSITSITSSGLETKRSVHPCSAKEKRKKEGKISEVKQQAATPCDHTQKQARDSLSPGMLSEKI